MGTARPFPRSLRGAACRRLSWCSLLADSGERAGQFRKAKARPEGQDKPEKQAKAIDHKVNRMGELKDNPLNPVKLQLHSMLTPQTALTYNP